jgi:hypothetical protein
MPCRRKRDRRASRKGRNGVTLVRRVVVRRQLSLLIGCFAVGSPVEVQRTVVLLDEENNH